MPVPGILAVALLLAACAGSSPPPPTARSTGPASTVPSPIDAGTSLAARPDASDEDPYTTLAARGAEEAPLLREIQRFEGNPSPFLADRDTCLRAVLSTSTPIEAWFEAGGARRGGVARGTELAVPPAGPACTRRGEPLRLVVSSDAGVSARGIVYASP